MSLDLFLVPCYKILCLFLTSKSYGLSIIFSLYPLSRIYLSYCALLGGGVKWNIQASFQTHLVCLLLLLYSSHILGSFILTILVIVHCVTEVLSCWRFLLEPSSSSECQLFLNWVYEVLLVWFKEPGGIFFQNVNFCLAFNEIITLLDNIWLFPQILITFSIQNY